MAKRAFDITIATLLIIALLPVLLVIALLLRLTSTGPLLFRQERVGEHGNLFQIYKFRSMRGPEDVVTKRTVTGVGAFLRAYSLDELPQLFNVLNGSMSLVGPRPHIVSEHETYCMLLPKYPERHATKPGMTGLAQIRGFNGPVLALKDLEGRLACDLEYLERKSIAFDVSILLRTIPVVVKGRVSAKKLHYRHPPQKKTLGSIRTAETS